MRTSSLFTTRPNSYLGYLFQMLGYTVVTASLSADQFVNAALPFDTSCYEIAIGDLDRDSDLDGWLICEGTHRVFLNDGSGIFVETGQQLPHSDHTGIALGDLDGDGDLDAFVLGVASNSVYWNDGRGQFTQGARILEDGSSRVVELADLEGDGDLDVIVGNNSTGINIWVNDGRGRFQPTEQSLLEETVTGLALGDLDGDGFTDLVVSTDEVHIFISEDGESFMERAVPLPMGRNIFLVDTDRDDDLDIWFSNRSRLDLPDRVFVNDGSGFFIDSGQMLPGGVLGFGDLDADGDLDALLSDGHILVNDGQGGLVRDENTSGIRSGTRAAIGELNGDALLDIWLLDGQSNRVFLNGVAPKIHSITLLGTNVEVRFIGTLLRADSVERDFVPLDSATSPFVEEITTSSRFFNVR